MKLMWHAAAAWRAHHLALTGSTRMLLCARPLKPHRMLQGVQLYGPAIQALTAQLQLVFAPGQAGAGSPMEGLLEVEEMLQGSFLRPQLERFHEELSDASLDAGLQVGPPVQFLCRLLGKPAGAAGAERAGQTAPVGAAGQPFRR